jgi:hypothetical protein
LPEFLYNYTIDIDHTSTYAAGYLIKQVKVELQPAAERLGTLGSGPPTRESGAREHCL